MDRKINRINVPSNPLRLISLLIITGVSLMGLSGCRPTQDAKQPAAPPQKGTESVKADEDILVFSVIPDYPPISFDDGGKPAGICVDILKALSDRTGIPIKIQMTPFNRALEDVKNGITDGMTPIYRTEEREVYLDFTSESLLPDSNSFFVRTDSDIVYDGDLKNIEDLTVGLVYNNRFGKVFDTAVATGKIKTEGASDIDGILKKLVGGRQDIIIGGTYPILYTSKKLGLSDQIKELVPAVSSEFIVISFSQKTDQSELIAKIDQVLKEMKADGSLDALLAKYQ